MRIAPFEGRSDPSCSVYCTQSTGCSRGKQGSVHWFPMTTEYCEQRTGGRTGEQETGNRWTRERGAVFSSFQLTRGRHRIRRPVASCATWVGGDHANMRSAAENRRAKELLLITMLISHWPTCARMPSGRVASDQRTRPGEQEDGWRNAHLVFPFTVRCLPVHRQPVYRFTVSSRSLFAVLLFSAVMFSRGLVH